MVAQIDTYGSALLKKSAARASTQIMDAQFIIDARTKPQNRDPQPI